MSDKVNDSYSEVHVHKSGVAQGSVLGRCYLVFIFARLTNLLNAKVLLNLNPIRSQIIVFCNDALKRQQNTMAFF